MNYLLYTAYPLWVMGEAGDKVPRGNPHQPRKSMQTLYRKAPG